MACCWVLESDARHAFLALMLLCGRLIGVGLKERSHCRSLSRFPHVIHTGTGSLSALYLSSVVCDRLNFRIGLPIRLVLCCGTLVTRVSWSRSCVNRFQFHASPYPGRSANGVIVADLTHHLLRTGHLGCSSKRSLPFSKSPACNHHAHRLSTLWLNLKLSMWCLWLNLFHMIS